MVGLVCSIGLIAGSVAVGAGRALGSFWSGRGLEAAVGADGLLAKEEGFVAGSGGCLDFEGMEMKSPLGEFEDAFMLPSLTTCVLPHAQPIFTDPMRYPASCPRHLYCISSFFDFRTRVLLSGVEAAAPNQPA